MTDEIQPPQFGPSVPEVSPQPTGSTTQKITTVPMRIVILVVIILLGVGLSFWLGYKSNSTKQTTKEGPAAQEESATKDPIVVIGNMERKRSELNSYHYDMVIEHILERQDKDLNSTIKLTMDGDINVGNGLDITQGKDMQFSGHAQVMVGVDTPSTLFEFYAIMHDQKIYYKITNADPKLAGIIKDKWIEFSGERESISQNADAQGVASGVLDFIPTIEKTIRQSHFFQKASELPSDTIAGQKTDHYKVSSTMDSVSDITLDGYFLISGIRHLFLAVDKGLSEQQINNDSAMRYAALLWDTLPEIPFEIWIGKDDHNLYRMKSEFTNDHIDTSIVEGDYMSHYPDPKTLRNDAKLTVKFIANFSDFNKELDIQTPVK